MKTNSAPFGTLATRTGLRRPEQAGGPPATRSLKRRRGRRAIAVGVAATMALGTVPVTAAPAAAAGANAAAFSCTMRVVDPTASSLSVYTLVEVKCNQSGYVGGFVSLFRNGTYLGTVDDYRSNASYAYALNMVACVPGNYYASGYGFGNINSGPPEFTQTITTATVTITCT